MTAVLQEVSSKSALKTSFAAHPSSLVVTEYSWIPSDFLHVHGNPCLRA